MRRTSLFTRDRWIEEYQFLGRRALVQDEKEFLTTRMAAAAKPFNCVLIGLCAIATTSLLVLCGTGVFASSFFFPVLTASLVAACAVPCQWSRQLKTYREALADIQVGEVEVFRTPASLSQQSLIVFLPKSGRLLSRQGRFVQDRVRLKVNAIAPPPLYPLKPFPRQFDLTDHRLTLVRPLNQQERRELASLLPKRRFLKLLAPTLVWTLALWLSLGWTADGVTGVALLRVALMAFGALAISVYYAYRHRRYETVRRDVNRGTVVCEHLGSYEFEHLASSSLLWTVAASPAAWRKRLPLSWICPTI